MKLKKTKRKIPKCPHCGGINYPDGKGCCETVQNKRQNWEKRFPLAKLDKT